MTFHAQRRIRVSTPFGYRTRITADAGLAHLLQLVHRCGFLTLMSCENINDSHRLWLAFPDLRFATWFRELLDELVPSVQVEVRCVRGIGSVWFSRGDLPVIEDALAAEAARRWGKGGHPRDGPGIPTSTPPWERAHIENEPVGNFGTRTL